MWSRVVSFLLSLYSFFYQAIVPCPFPELMPVNTIDQQQYLGKWYFRAAVSRHEAEIAKFKPLDSLWFNMEKSSNDTLLLTGHMHMKGNCIKETWTYRIHMHRDDLELEAFSRMVPPCQPGPARGFFLLKGSFSCHYADLGVPALGFCLWKPHRRNLLWSGRWANCPECIVLQELEPPASPSASEDSLNRLLLYARHSHADPEVVAAFLKNTACHNMSASVTLPQGKEFCK